MSDKKPTNAERLAVLEERSKWQTKMLDRLDKKVWVLILIAGGHFAATVTNHLGWW